MVEMKERSCERNEEERVGYCQSHQSIYLEIKIQFPVAMELNDGGVSGEVYLALGSFKG